MRRRCHLGVGRGRFGSIQWLISVSKPQVRVNVRRTTQKFHSDKINAVIICK